MSYVVEIKIKPKFLDPLGEGFKEQALSLGEKNIKNVRVGRLFSLKGNITKAQVKRIANGLLTDKVVEDCILNYRTGKKNNLHKIEIWLKLSATDVVGESVKEAILDMGVNGISDARCGFAYYIEGKVSKSRLDFLTRKILANPLIHNYKVS